ncbi:MFS transporter [Streptomyces sp. NBC_01236]|uniref:MFS transporter n=1 Tax=Streptomyces sp. NBC_01236 TaxID=2903789 RepID=UPI002E14DB5D|nr:MFS transporter [Streptomyces sp. NBC_01236]
MASDLRGTVTEPRLAHGERPLPVLIAACVGLFTVFLQTTQTIGTLSAVQDDLHIASADLVWVPSMYTLVVASCVLGAGSLADRWGRRRVFLAGAATMAAGGVVLVLAGNLAAVLAGQAVAGLGGALITPSSLALITHAVPDPRRRAGAIAAWAATSGLGLAIGPVTAGLALRWWTWHTAFWLNLVVAALGSAVALRYVEESRNSSQRLDWAGQSTAIGGLALMVFWLIDGGHHGYGSGRALAAAAGAVVLLAAFVLVELRRTAPMVDLRLMRDPSYGASLLLAATVLFGFVGLSLLEVLWLQRVRGLSALEVGAQLLAEFGTFIAASVLAGVLVRRLGPRTLITAGLLLAALGATLFARVDPGTTFSGYAAALVVFGLGCGLANAPSTALAVSHVPRGREGEAGGTVNAARQIGAVLGTSVLGTLMTSRFDDRVAHIRDPRVAFTEAVGYAVWIVVAVLLVGAAVGLALSAWSRRGTAVAPQFAEES